MNYARLRFNNSRPDLVDRVNLCRQCRFGEIVTLAPRIGDDHRRIVLDRSSREREGIDLAGNSFLLHPVRDYARDQFLFELANVHERDTDARVLKSIDRLASKGQPILVRQFDLEPKFVASKDIVFPTRKAAADADLLKHGILPLAVFVYYRRGNIEGKSNVFALIYGHGSGEWPEATYRYFIVRTFGKQ